MKSNVFLNKIVPLLLLILAWIIFVGLSIVAGAFFTNAIFVVVKPEVVPRLWQEANLLPLYEFDRVYFFIQTVLISVAVIMKCTLFYQIIMLLQNKKVDFTQPFNEELSRFLKNLSGLSLMIGVSCKVAEKFSVSMIKKGILMPSSDDMQIDGGGCLDIYGHHPVCHYGSDPKRN